jgi:flagellar biosynthesis anti-sigma factor FlgM
VNGINQIQTQLGGIYYGSLGEANDSTAVNGAVKQNNSAIVPATFGSRDGVEISSSGILLRKASAAVDDLPDVREDRVSAIRSLIANGNYSIDYNQLASNLLG